MESLQSNKAVGHKYRSMEALIQISLKNLIASCSVVDALNNISCLYLVHIFI